MWLIGARYRGFIRLAVATVTVLACLLVQLALRCSGFNQPQLCRSVLGQPASMRMDERSSGFVFPLDHNSSLDIGIRLYASIGSGPVIGSTIDTGSEGILFSRKFLGPDVVDTHEPFCLEYTSSRNVYRGTWVTASVVFSSARNPEQPGVTRARTVRIRVRAVDERNGEKDQKKFTTAMIGVGFDRDTSPGQHDTCGNPVPNDINPFLALEAMRLPRSALKPGFVIDWTSRALILGLSSADDRGFHVVQLKRTQHGWGAPAVVISLADANIVIEDAILLMDSGVGNTIVQAPLGIDPPLGPHRRGPVTAGQRVQVAVEGLQHPIYTFTVGDESTGAPKQVLWGHALHDGRPFINTGRYALSQFDYMFDAHSGRLGFRFRT